MSPNSMRNVCPRDFFAWCVAFCFASLAVTAAAQAQTPGQSPNPNAPIVVPPDAQAQSQPSANLWDRWGIQKVSKDDDWTRHFRIGAMAGLNISANFNMKGSFNTVDPTKGIFEDGYVRSDGTGDNTGFWGYNDASQYNAANQTLSMHAVSSYSPTSGTGAREDGAFVGFDMAYGGNLWNWGQTRIGWELGFGLLPISFTDNHTMSASAYESTYIFNTGGDIPDAPYQGTLGGMGEPIIPVKPSQITDTQPISGTGKITGSRTLDVMLYTVRLGPSAYWDLNQYLGLSAGVGPAVGIVSGSYKYNETVKIGDFCKPSQVSVKM